MHRMHNRERKRGKRGKDGERKLRDKKRISKHITASRSIERVFRTAPAHSFCCVAGKTGAVGPDDAAPTAEMNWHKFTRIDMN